MKQSQLTCYKVNSFALTPDGGNPAVVYPLTSWLPEAEMQSIATAEGAPATAFFVADGSDAYSIRWFTPDAEIRLCGHATLASAGVIFKLGLTKGSEIKFNTKYAGALSALKAGDKVTINLPTYTLTQAEPGTQREYIQHWQGEKLTELLRDDTGIYVAVLSDYESVSNAAIDFSAMANASIEHLSLTAKADLQLHDADVVSRFFSPNAKVKEDYVTGSSFSRLAPYWAAQLGKNEFVARQVSSRGGELSVRLCGDTVELTGALYFYSG